MIRVDLARPSRTSQIFRFSPLMWRLCRGLAGLVLGVAASATCQTAPAAAAPAAMTAGEAAAPTATSTGGRQTSSTSQANRSTVRDAEARDSRDQAEIPAGSLDARTEFQQMVQTTTGRALPIFGASLFNAVPSTFAPVSDVPVSPEYVLGPGDQIDVQLSGQINQQLELTIDRTGAVSIPGVGAVHLAGLPFGQLNSFLQTQLGRIYRNFSVSSNLGALRSIQVFVVGQARRPGTYSISSLSTLTNAVFASGGILPQGSLRDIQVKRGGVTVDHFDLYDLLLHGDKSHDVPLLSGDVIFIPFVGPQVAVVGSIDVPAIYELSGPTTVGAAIQFAGGETAVAAGKIVRLDRIFEHSMRSLQDVNLSQSGGTLLQNGDIISLTSVIDRFRDAVTLRGNVANPGRYVWHPGMHISDLIPNKDSLITRNYWRKRNELGQLTQDYGPAPPTDQGEGALQVHGSSANNAADAQATRGNAGSSGASVGAALTGNNSPFGARTDVILSAPDIDWNYAVIERQSSEDLTTSLIPFSLGNIVLKGELSQNYALLPGDVITIFSKADIRVPTSQQTRYVRLEGEFNAAGIYSVLPGETLRGLLTRVGGFTPDAYLFASEFTRESTRRVQQQRLNEYADQLEAEISSTTSASQARALSTSDQLAASASEADARTAVARLRTIVPIGRIVLSDLKPDSAGIDAVPDLALEDGDRFVVPRIPANVTVEGQVYNANAFVYTPGQRVIDYLKRAGGPDREADRRRLFVLRADGSVVSRQYADVAHAAIFPGDTIVVPPVIDKRAFFQRVVDIAQIVGNLGIGAATLAILAHDY